MLNSTCRTANLRVARRRLAWPAFWLVSAVVSGFALYPRLTLPEPHAIAGYTQYIEHAGAFFVLTTLAAGARGMNARLALAMTLAAGALELAQMLSPGRQTSLIDFLASASGVALAVALVAAWRWRSRARRSAPQAADAAGGGRKVTGTR